MKPSRSANPFDLLLRPDDVLRAVESSEPLGGLRSTVFRPLDRPAAASGTSRTARGGDDDDEVDEDSDELRLS